MARFWLKLWRVCAGRAGDGDASGDFGAVPAARRGERQAFPQRHGVHGQEDSGGEVSAELWLRKVVSQRPGINSNCAGVLGCRQVVIMDAAHAANIQQPAQFNSAIVDFLQGAPPSASL